MNRNGRFQLPGLNMLLGGAPILGRKPSARKQDGWRLLVKDDRKLVKQILLNQDTMRLAKVIPDWSNFITTETFRDMRQYLDGTMMAKYRAWWELLYEVGAGLDSEVQKRRLRLVFGVLVVEGMRRNHGKTLPLDGVGAGLSIEEAGKIHEAVLSRFAALTTR